MNIKETVKIYKMIMKSNTSIIDHDDTGLEIEKTQADYDTFAVFRILGKSYNFNENEREKLVHFGGLLKINTEGILNGDFFVVPLKEGMTSFKYLKVKDGETLEIGDEIFKLPTSILKAENKSAWMDYPCAIFQTAFDMIGMFNVVCEAGFNASINENNKLKTLVDFFEIMKKNRIKLGNTIVNNVFLELGKTKFDALKEEYNVTKDVTAWLVSEYKKLNKEIIDKMKEKNPKRVTFNIDEKNFKKFGDEIGNKIIPDYFIFKFLEIYSQLDKVENDVQTFIKNEVHKERIWSEYLEGVPGCGELSAAYLIATLNPYKARHASSYVRYCGLDVRPDPKNEGKYAGTNKTFTRPSVYINSAGEADVCETLGYNPLIKSRIIGILVPCFLKARNSAYAAIYYNTKYYYANRPDLKELFESGKTGRSAHKMAMRKVASMFIEDYWIADRRLHGLPLNNGRYAEAKLGIIHNYNRPTLENPNPEVIRIDK